MQNVFPLYDWTIKLLLLYSYFGVNHVYLSRNIFSLRFWHHLVAFFTTLNLWLCHMIYTMWH